MKNSFSKIAVFTYSSEAQIIKSRLEAEGIEVFLFDQFTVDTDPLVSNAIGGIKLKVWAQDEERALKILENISEYPVDDEGLEIECPICYSHRVELYKKVRGLDSFFKYLISFLKTDKVKPRFDYHCNHCKQNFNLDD
jgi:hypothetical protein